MLNAIQTDVEARLRAFDPTVDVLLAEVGSGSVLRVFIDHPDGVGLELCERVTRALAPLREFYALEVSSPGPERPLTRPEHFRRFVGRRARVRTRVPYAAPTRGELRAACRSFTGELLDASEDEVTVAADVGVVSIAYADIHRSNLLGE